MRANRHFVISWVSPALALFLAGCTTFARMNSRRPGNHALITPFEDNAGGEDRLRVAIKDNIDLAGVVTTAGSKQLALEAKPAAKDAACLAITRERGVHIVGKTNMSEFAVSPSGVNEYFGTPRNPFDFWRKRIPGGSSSGSAVAVAGDLADVAFGTDTAGSIRVPAACCGVVGLKTTHGLIPLTGIHPIEPEHMDTVGPLARDIAGTVVGMDLLQQGFVDQYAAAVAAQPRGRDIRVGRLRLSGTDRRIDTAIDLALLKAGFRIVPLDPKLGAMWEQAKADGNTVAAAGAWISDKKYGSSLSVSMRTKVVILTGRLNYMTKYQAALGRRARWQAALDDAFEKVDVIALPTMQGVPPFIPPSWDMAFLEAQMLQLQNTVPFNYSGHPALAQPIKLHNAGFSLTSIQLIGPKSGEAKLLNAGRIIEQKSFPSDRGTSYDRLERACGCPGTAEKVLRFQAPSSVDDTLRDGVPVGALPLRRGVSLPAQIRALEAGGTSSASAPANGSAVKRRE
jgi:Asp-tRNA(Asn)/Glu-tRNA(Gln) amidotransferase A subunit family amidase